MSEWAVYLRLDVNAKEAGVEVDLEFEGVVREAPAIAWELSHSERVSMGVHLGGFVSPMCEPTSFLGEGHVLPRVEQLHSGRAALFFYGLFLILLIF